MSKKAKKVDEKMEYLKGEVKTTYKYVRNEFDSRRQHGNYLSKIELHLDQYGCPYISKGKRSCNNVCILENELLFFEILKTELNKAEYSAKIKEGFSTFLIVNDVV